METISESKLTLHLVNIQPEITFPTNKEKNSDNAHQFIL